MKLVSKISFILVSYENNETGIIIRIVKIDLTSGFYLKIEVYIQTKEI